jgi:hypothetical protein
MIPILQITAFTFWILLILFILLSAVRRLILPCAAPNVITNNIFRSVWWFFDTLLNRTDVYETRDRIMAFYAPIALFTLLQIWLILVTLGYTAMYRALGVPSWI